MKKGMNTNEVVNLLMSREIEITNKFHHAILQISFHGYDTEKGKAAIPDLMDSVQYSLEEIQRIINR